ncbi:hypothetical protein ACHAWX_002755 [Stephanocyclus meneghinianus]
MKIPNTSKSSPEEEHTLGEELYLVHLQRMSAPDPHPEDTEDDHDQSHPRKLNRTVGEELFAVHLKRSAGTDPDYDVPLEQGGDIKRNDVQKNGDCAYALRSKDKHVKVAQDNK